MSAKANPTVIGVFVVAAALIAAGGLLVLGSGRLFQEATSFVLYFEGDLSGLEAGAPVSFQGVSVGQVAKVSIVYDHATDEVSRPVVITMRKEAFAQRNVEQEGPEGSVMPKHIQRGLRAQLASQSLVTGKLKVSLGYFPDNEAVFRAAEPEFPEIPTIPAVFDSLAKRIGDLPLEEIVIDLREATQGVARLVNSGELERTLEGLNELMRSVQQVMEAPELRSGMASFAQAMASVSKVAEGPELRNAMAAIDETMVSFRNVVESQEFKHGVASIDQTLQEIQDLMRDVQEGVDPLRRELMVALEGIVDTARVAQSFLEYIERHPEALIQGKGKE